MRIVSLLPSATEIVAALGCADRLVGISHECDFPARITHLPRVTQCEIHGADLPSAQIDAWVRETLASRGTLYTLDEQLVRDLRPDVILTQQLCDVCAVNYGSVAAFARSLARPPLVVNLQPSTLEEVLGDIGRVGAALEATAKAEPLMQELAQPCGANCGTHRGGGHAPDLLPDGMDRSAVLRRALEPATGQPGRRHRSDRPRRPAFQARELGRDRSGRSRPDRAGAVRQLAGTRRA